jgi:hypothetical protein
MNYGTQPPHPPSSNSGTNNRTLQWKIGLGPAPCIGETGFLLERELGLC